MYILINSLIRIELKNKSKKGKLTIITYKVIIKVNSPYRRKVTTIIVIVGKYS